MSGPTNNHALSELDQKIADILAKMAKEQKIIDASNAIRMATRNQDVLRKTDAEEREARRSLEYFQATLGQLRSKRDQLIHGQHSPQDRTSPQDSFGYQGGSQISQRSAGYDKDRSLPSPPLYANDPDPTGPVYDPRPKQYTNLDLIKADTPHTPAKIQRMLHQLEFKLQVERQYQKGFDLMQRAYNADGDKKSRLDAQNQKIESDKTIQLLTTALKRYKNLHVIEVAEEEETGDPAVPEGDRKGNLRKPLTGTLHITVKAARELEHAPLAKRSAKIFNETTVVLKIEGNARAKSHPSRTDRWNQDFEISVDKANEVTIAIYDKQGNEMPVPIGFTWIRLSDLVEALRRLKVGMEAAGGGWVTAAGAMSGAPSGLGGGRYQQPGMDSPLMPYGVGTQMGGPGVPGAPGAGSDGIEAWFMVEPAGAVLLHLNFVKENARKRPMDAGLLRQVALRKRKEVHEMNGHKFVPQQFYQIILCAYCNEFLLNATGYQCEDCRYTCHKKCYEKVLTKCISKSTTDTEGDEDKIKHRIPHRFETITNIGANWCCHCGYMLPLGRKNARKCSECGVTCHATCTHFVPDFCGMTMETANALLANIRDIKRSHQNKRSITSPPSKPTYGQYEELYPLDSPLQQRVEGLDLNREDYPPQPYQQPGVAPPERQQTQTPVGMYELNDARYMPPQQPQIPQPPIPAPQPFTQPSPPPSIQSSRTSQPPPPGSQGRIPIPFQTQASRPGQSSSMDQQPYGGFPPQQTPPRRDDYTGGPPQGGRYTPGPPPPPQQQGPPSRAGTFSTGPAPMQQQQQQPVRQPTRKRRVGLDDFNFLAVLGKGNFGKVMLAEEKKTSNLYAIKVLKKEFIIDNDEVESTRSEKRVFLAAARARHPFLLNLHSCFQTETRVYFVMEYVSGGDLMLHIQRKQFSLRQAKFYASEVLLALEYFHSNGIIYRDLKLDNILLTLDGHVKVADYGLCKEEMFYGSTTSTFCGTPEFMAPEILLEQRYGRAVDWWAFGVLTYEMLLGQSPFRGDDEDEIFDAILEDEPLYPITMPKDAVSILQKLLTRDPTRRLGSGKGDAEEIKRHPFFKDVNWDDVVNKRIPPPYFPQIKAPGDVSNFDQEFTREQPTLTPVHGQLTQKDQMEFHGFSWVAAWADD